MVARVVVTRLVVAVADADVVEESASSVEEESSTRAVVVVGRTAGPEVVVAVDAGGGVAWVVVGLTGAVVPGPANGEGFVRILPRAHISR